MTEITNNIMVVVGACIISILMEMILLPRIIYVAKKKKLFDLPDKRKKHKVPIPRLGGTSFTPIILFVTFFTVFIRIKLHMWTESTMELMIPEISLFVCGLLLIYLLGIKDDLVGVSFKKKFVMQFVASLFIVGSGSYINNFYGLLGIHQIPDWLGIIISVVFIMFTTNAINLIDGTDGLASGISAVALIVYGIIFAIYNMWTYASIAFITIGVLSPFFYYNFFHSTRKIFMGDTGSLTLGYMLSFMVIRLAKYPPITDIVPSGLLLFVLSALFIPLFDAVKVMIIRVAMGRMPFSPDRNHIHHKLIDLGFSKQLTVCLIIGFSILFIILNWLLLHFGFNCNLVLAIDLCIGVSLNLVIYRAMRIRLRKGLLPKEGVWINQ